MKKIGLLLVTTIFLSGCSATSGILTREDVIEAGKGDTKEIIERQKEVSYVPEDVKEFLKEVKVASESFDESSYDYLNVILDSSSENEDSEFLKELYISNNVDRDSSEEFKKLIDLLDETIAKGIKLYLDKNIDADLEKAGISTKIGRALVSIRPLEVIEETHSYPDVDVTLDGDFKNEFTKNEVSIVLKLKDVRDPNYKAMLEKIVDENLVTDSIKVGKNQDLIRLSDIKSKHYSDYGYNISETSTNYYLFMKDKTIDKVRMNVTAMADKNMDSDLQSLTRLANVLEFDIEDMKKLEELKSIIKENKVGKKTLSSEKFNFDYSNLQRGDNLYSNGKIEKINTAEIVIEKKK